MSAATAIRLGSVKCPVGYNVGKCVGLDWIGLDWAGLDWTDGFERRIGLDLSDWDVGLNWRIGLSELIIGVDGRMGLSDSNIGMDNQIANIARGQGGRAECLVYSR